MMNSTNALVGHDSVDVVGGTLCHALRQRQSVALQPCNRDNGGLQRGNTPQVHSLSTGSDVVRLRCYISKLTTQLRSINISQVCCC